jgi:tellurite resistance protein TehA-like permease
MGSCLPPLEEFSALSLILGWLILVITILSLIRHLIFKHLDELVEETAIRDPRIGPIS